jgi:hypothetical protein
MKAALLIKKKRSWVLSNLIGFFNLAKKKLFRDYDLELLTKM